MGHEKEGFFTKRFEQLRAFIKDQRQELGWDLHIKNLEISWCKSRICAVTTVVCNSHERYYKNSKECGQ